MSSLNMEGPFPFTPESIESHVYQNTAGNYALGRMNENDRFSPKFVGRSDTDVNSSLKLLFHERLHPLFKFCYADSPRAAFEKECENWHDFDPPENINHPFRPDGTDWKCPRCDLYD